MKEQIKLLSIQEDNIVFEKPRNLLIENIYLMNDKNEKVAIKVKEESDESTDELNIENPSSQLSNDIDYYIYINEKEVSSTEYLIIGVENLIIEQNSTSICFRKKVNNTKLFFERRQIPELEVEKVKEKQIKLLSIQKDIIVFEKPRNLLIENIYLMNDKNEKVAIKMKKESDELINKVSIENPSDQLTNPSGYILYINDKKIGNEEYLILGAEGLIIEQNSTSICFRKKVEDIALLDSNHLLQDDIPIKKVYFQDGNLLLEFPNQTVSSTNTFGFFAVNKETKEIRSLSFYYLNNSFFVSLAENFDQGLWNINILHQFNQYFLLDTIVQGDANYINKPYFIGYVGENEGSHIGAYFKSNHLIIANLFREEFVENIPVNIKMSILIDDVQVYEENKKSLELRIANKNLALSSKLANVVFVSRRSKERIVIPFIKKSNDVIQILLTTEALEQVKNGRWDLEMVFVSENNCIAGRLRNKRKTDGKLVFVDDHIDDYEIMVYTTKYNNFSVLKAPSSAVFIDKHKIKTKLIDITKNKKRGYKLALQVQKNGMIEIQKIVLKLRSDDTMKLIVTEDTQVEALNNNNYIVNGSFRMDWDKDFHPLYWDIFIQVVNNKGIEELIRVTGVTNNLRKKVNKDYLKNAIYTDNKILYPYITLKKDIAFMMRDKEGYENMGTRIKEKFAFLTYLLLNPFYYRKKDIWLGFEKFSSTAQDNGYAFFQYIDKNKLHDNFYYILRKDSSDYEKASKESKKIVPFMSFKYFLLIFASDLFVTSESKRHVYNLRVRSGLVAKKVESKKSVFLQHGVTALKKSNVFKKAKGRGNFNLVIATSDMEKEIIHQNWKYELNEIAVTGFSRWDKLKDKSKDRERKKIFVMPTWRTWMEGMPIDEFKQTDYYHNYQGFLNSKELEATLNKHNLELVFFLHPKFKEYFSAFEFTNEAVQIKEFQNIKVNEEIMEASLMISDYSSVTWDMFYIKKPIIFFQFDFEKYNEYEGSYINMEKELFGDRALNMEGLIKLINDYAAKEFRLGTKYQRLHDTYFKYINHKNAERTYEAIKRLKLGEK
ncbi:CDP-glycerol glycerophosphotransferase family protein [Oceanobacillus neutriphilus]|uniref:CDP-glycerol glycerophosphotransferase (TagB/SpsB family) n=1 Tax=Oceanobacillus neutriphilus TaxID=531815 RepID=A0ABQ2P0E7_9BACI|nr:CDP-glycerol glycerophosphotransferase family protein [Oceanobacillus neutriphilus]GGP15125.1 hypothetical protein GCM10011346_41690 [Oceanobacillus neutriphilus]